MSSSSSFSFPDLFFSCVLVILHFSILFRNNVTTADGPPILYPELRVSISSTDFCSLLRLSISLRFKTIASSLFSLSDKVNISLKKKEHGTDREINSFFLWVVVVFWGFFRFVFGGGSLWKGGEKYLSSSFKNTHRLLRTRKRTRTRKDRGKKRREIDQIAATGPKTARSNLFVRIGVNNEEQQRRKEKKKKKKKHNNSLLQITTSPSVEASLLLLLLLLFLSFVSLFRLSTFLLFSYMHEVHAAVADTFYNPAAPRRDNGSRKLESSFFFYLLFFFSCRLSIALDRNWIYIASHSKPLLNARCGCATTKASRVENARRIQKETRPNEKKKNNRRHPREIF